MRSAFQNVFFLLLVAAVFACGSEKQVVSTEANPVRKESAPQFSGPGESRTDLDERTVLQIVCESSETKLAMPNSLQALGTRNRELIYSDRESMAAPMFLGLNNGVARVLWNAEGNLTWVDYSLRDFQEIGKRNFLAKINTPNGALANRLGVRGVKFAAVSPQGSDFVLTLKDRIEIRSVLNPERKLKEFKVSGQLANPRWVKEKQEIFLDRISTKGQGQVLVRLDDNGELAAVIELPKAKLSMQLGLRRMNESLVWMEWSEKNQLIRLWNPRLKKASDYEIPQDWKVGPGFTLSADQEGVVVMQSALGIFYGKLIDGRLSLERKLEYLPTVEDNIRRGLYNWKPGQIYSSANDRQLFVVLPSTFGRMLYAIDQGRFFRKLGEEPCENPEFTPVYE